MTESMKEKSLSLLTTKQLLEIAKSLGVVGRHDMKKDQLISAIVKKSEDAVAAHPELVEKLAQTRHDDAPDAVMYAVLGLEKRVLEGDSSLEPVGIFQSMEEQMAKGAQEEWEDVCVEEIDLSTLPKPKAEYIDNAKIGTIIAFTVNKAKVLSGMIEEIHKTDFLVRTKSGVLFTVRKKNVLWVRTGKRWPRGVYLAMKGESTGGKDYDSANN